MEFKLGYVQPEGTNIIIECYLSEQEWNGYAVPFFSFRQLREIEKAINEADEHQKLSIKAENESVFYRYGEEDPEEGEIEWADIYFGRYYGLGAGRWCWVKLSASDLFRLIGTDCHITKIEL